MYGRGVFRIRSMVDFETIHGNIRKGDSGGYIEKEENLSHEGNCWVSDTAKVYGNALVVDNAIIKGNAVVCDDALIHDSAVIS